ncbi:GIY-YIG nuclease family protein, partial [Ramlibacter sp.]
MSIRAKTIQIFLPSGDPQGIRQAEITTRIVRLIEVPRKLLKDFLAMPESAGGAVYFLFGEGEESAKPQVYIGQTGDLKKRLVKHQKEKDFWHRAVVMLSRADSLTTTHSLYLERLCIQRAKAAGRYTVENDTNGS